ncbi:MAG: hypothetical protein ACOX8H_05045 [Ruminococcus sp.]|jgi:hypothetical protein
MAISEFSKIYHEKMFPDYHSAFLETDPEFIERFDNFAFDEVVNHDDLDDKIRFMAILATLLGCQGADAGFLEVRPGRKPPYQYLAGRQLLRRLLYPQRT